MKSPYNFISKHSLYLNLSNQVNQVVTSSVNLLPSKDLEVRKYICKPHVSIIKTTCLRVYLYEIAFQSIIWIIELYLIVRFYFNFSYQYLQSEHERIPILSLGESLESTSSCLRNPLFENIPHIALMDTDEERLDLKPAEPETYTKYKSVLLCFKSYR